MTGKYANQYGECALCGYVGTMMYHHLIPKRAKIVTSKRPKFYIEIIPNGIASFEHHHKDSRIENVMIRICSNCHERLHPENKHFSNPQHIKITKRTTL